MKKCKRCQIAQSLEEFNKYYKDKETRRNICRACIADNFKKNYDPVLASKRHQKFRENNLEKCREIRRRSTKKYRENHADKIKLSKEERKEELLAKKRQKPKPVNPKKYYNKERNVKAVLAWRARNPEKAQCAILARKAIKQGLIIKARFCQICGLEKKLEGHHYDYNKPLEVIWCCRSCHATLDRVRRLCK